MRKINMRLGFLVIAAACWAAPSAAGASEGVDEVLALAKRDVGEEVLLAFVETSRVAYALSFEEILELHDLGLPSKVIAAMIRHGEALRRQAGQDASESKTPGQTAPPPEPASRPEENAPESRALLSAPSTPEPSASEDPAPLYAFSPPQNPGLPPESVTSTTASTSVPVIEEYYVPEPLYVPEPDRLTVSFFYEALAPYGAWRQDPHFGWVWQPTVVRINPGWRPYCQGGRWLWTDQGWHWHSTYSWGWAPFHYGRWAYTESRRWAWVPGTVWSPAWVQWRSSNAYYGWAPLPPQVGYQTGVGFSYLGRHAGYDFHFGLAARDYVFVPAHGFLAPNLAPLCVPSARVAPIYGRSALIRNAYRYRNQRLINQGIPPRQVSLATGRRLRLLSLAERGVKPGERLRPNERQKDRLVVFRPKIKNRVTVLPPAVIARRKARAARREKARLEAARRRRLKQARPGIKAVPPQRAPPLSKTAAAPTAPTAPGRPAPRNPVRTAPPPGKNPPAQKTRLRKTPRPAASRPTPKRNPRTATRPQHMRTCVRLHAARTAPRPRPRPQPRPKSSKNIRGKSPAPVPKPSAPVETKLKISRRPTPRPAELPVHQKPVPKTKRSAAPPHASRKSVPLYKELLETRQKATLDAARRRAAWHAPRGAAARPKSSPARHEKTIRTAPRLSTPGNRPAHVQASPVRPSGTPGIIQPQPLPSSRFGKKTPRPTSRRTPYYRRVPSSRTTRPSPGVKKSIQTPRVPGKAGTKTARPRSQRWTRRRSSTPIPTRTPAPTAPSEPAQPKK